MLGGQLCEHTVWQVLQQIIVFYCVLQELALASGAHTLSLICVDTHPYARDELYVAKFPTDASGEEFVRARIQSWYQVRRSQNIAGKPKPSVVIAKRSKEEHLLQGAKQASAKPSKTNASYANHFIAVMNAYATQLRRVSGDESQFVLLPISDGVLEHRVTLVRLATVFLEMDMNGFDLQGSVYTIVLDNLAKRRPAVDPLELFPAPSTLSNHWRAVDLVLRHVIEKVPHYLGRHLRHIVGGLSDLKNAMQDKQSAFHRARLDRGLCKFERE